MLALRRKKDQTLVFSHPKLEGDITVTIAAIESSGRVKIGIDAPRSVLIARGELLPWKPQTEQGECPAQLAPKIWLKADREKAKQASGPAGRAYIEELEIIARLADAFWTTMSPKCDFEQGPLSDKLLDALSRVNFLSSTDEAHEEEELPRDVIFS